MIKLKKVSKSYPIGNRKLEVLKKIDLKIKAGEFVSIMGSSGSGKSTLLNILGLLDDYDSGEYYLNKTLIRDLSEKEAALFRCHHIAFIFQSFHLLKDKNALENVALPLYYQKVPRKKRNQIAMEYLDKVGLKDWAVHMPFELSGGQQQRVAVARSLISNPKVILADEPTGALDSATSNEIMELLKSVNKKGMTILIVTHENDIAHMTDRIIHIKDGKIED